MKIIIDHVYQITLTQTYACVWCLDSSVLSLVLLLHSCHYCWFSRSFIISWQSLLVLLCFVNVCSSSPICSNKNFVSSVQDVHLDYMYCCCMIRFQHEHIHFYFVTAFQVKLILQRQGDSWRHSGRIIENSSNSNKEI